MTPLNTPEQALDLTMYRPPSEVYHHLNTPEEEVYRPPSDQPESEDLPELPFRQTEDLPDLPFRRMEELPDLSSRPATQSRPEMEEQPVQRPVPRPVQQCVQRPVQQPVTQPRPPASLMVPKTKWYPQRSSPFPKRKTQEQAPPQNLPLPPPFLLPPAFPVLNMIKTYFDSNLYNIFRNRTLIWVSRGT
ncbi:hypothetical protein TNCV_922401 [Trichonephila clavipes]|nr:hypothetical protein TNCV_922401 [Trichonephila clavipes]